MQSEQQRRLGEEDYEDIAATFGIVGYQAMLRRVVRDEKREADGRAPKPKWACLCQDACLLPSSPELSTQCFRCTSDYVTYQLCGLNLEMCCAERRLGPMHLYICFRQLVAM